MATFGADHCPPFFDRFAFVRPQGPQHRSLYIPARRTRATPASMFFLFLTTSIHHKCAPPTISETRNVRARHRQRPCRTPLRPSSASLSSPKTPSCGQKRTIQCSPAHSVPKARDPLLSCALHNAPPRITLETCSVTACPRTPSRTTAMRMRAFFAQPVPFLPIRTREGPRRAQRSRVKPRTRPDASLPLVQAPTLLHPTPSRPRSNVHLPSNWGPLSLLDLCFPTKSSQRARTARSVLSRSPRHRPPSVSHQFTPKPLEPSNHPSLRSTILQVSSASLRLLPSSHPFPKVVTPTAVRR